MNSILLRKELRQLAPLTIAVLLLCLLCYCLLGMLPNSWYSLASQSGYILIAIPALFAVGAGAMSISQEKETRTLTWLSSLPLASQRLIRHKFSAALICWLGLWLFTILLYHFITSIRWAPPFPYHSAETNPFTSAWLMYWILNSFYLLVCGFLTAWRFGSSMTALLAFIPCAIAPTVIRFSIAYLQDPFYDLNSSRYDPTLVPSLLVVGGALVAAVWLMNRSAAAALAPQQTITPRNPYAATDLPSDATIQTSQSVLNPSTAMLWQYFRQNKTAYVSLCGLALVAGLFLLSVADTIDKRQSGWEVICIVIVFVVTAWMGVLVFQGDNLQDRIRFLAERGVTPFKAWLTRQLLPLAFVCIAALFYLLILARYDRQNHDQEVPLWMVLWVLLVSYGYAQWFAQLVRNPILSVIGGPILASSAFAYAIYATIELTSVKSFIAVISIAPFVATLTMMRRWMDRRFEWPYWCAHLAILCIAIGLPIADLAWYVWQSPRMPGSVKTALRAEGRELGDDVWGRKISLAGLIRIGSYGFGELPVSERVKFAKQEADIDELLRRFREATRDQIGIRLYSDDIDEVIGRIILDRALLDTKPDDPVALKDYQGRLELLGLIARTARGSVNLVTQTQADMAEIALIAELQQPSTKARISGEAWQRYVGLVSDPKARNEARRRAVVASWFEYQKPGDERPYRSFGGFYPTPSSPNLQEFSSTTRELLARPGRIDHLAWVLLQYLEAGPTATVAGKQAFLRRRWPLDNNESDRTDFDPKYWINDPAKFEQHNPHYRLPGDQWFAGWEKVGEEIGKL